MKNHFLSRKMFPDVDWFKVLPYNLIIIRFSDLSIKIQTVDGVELAAFSTLDHGIVIDDVLALSPKVLLIIAHDTAGSFIHVVDLKKTCEKFDKTIKLTDTVTAALLLKPLDQESENYEEAKNEYKGSFFVTANKNNELTLWMWRPDSGSVKTVFTAKNHYSINQLYLLSNNQFAAVCCSDNKSLIIVWGWNMSSLENQHVIEHRNKTNTIIPLLNRGFVSLASDSFKVWDYNDLDNPRTYLVPKERFRFLLPHASFMAAVYLSDHYLAILVNAHQDEMPLYKDEVENYVLIWDVNKEEFVDFVPLESGINWSYYQPNIMALPNGNFAICCHEGTSFAIYCQVAAYPIHKARLLVYTQDSNHTYVLGKEYKINYHDKLLFGVASDGSLISCETNNGRLTKYFTPALNQLGVIKDYFLRSNKDHFMLPKGCVDLIVQYFGFMSTKANAQSNQKTEKIGAIGYPSQCVIS